MFLGELVGGVNNAISIWAASRVTPSRTDVSQKDQFLIGGNTARQLLFAEKQTRSATIWDLCWGINTRVLKIHALQNNNGH